MFLWSLLSTYATELKEHAYTAGVGHRVLVKPYFPHIEVAVAMMREVSSFGGVESDVDSKNMGEPRALRKWGVFVFTDVRWFPPLSCHKPLRQNLKVFAAHGGFFELGRRESTLQPSACIVTEMTSKCESNGIWIDTQCTNRSAPSCSGAEWVF